MLQKNQGEKCLKRAEEDGNLSVEEVLTEDQEKTEEITTAEVVNGGKPAGRLYEGEPIVDEECQWPG